MRNKPPPKVKFENSKNIKNGTTSNHKNHQKQVRLSAAKFERIQAAFAQVAPQ
jgi:hypothetical protein